jgi:hypothetical protein
MKRKYVEITQAEQKLEKRSKFSYIRNPPLILNRIEDIWFKHHYQDNKFCTDIFVNVASFLYTQDLLNFGLVSKRFHAMSQTAYSSVQYRNGVRGLIINKKEPSNILIYNKLNNVVFGLGLPIEKRTSMCIEMLKNVLSNHDFKTSCAYFSVTHHRVPSMIDQSQFASLFVIIDSISNYELSVTDAKQDTVRTHFKITINNKL